MDEVYDRGKMNCRIASGGPGAGPCPGLGLSRFLVPTNVGAMEPPRYRLRPCVNALAGAALATVVPCADAVAAGPTIGALIEVCDRAFAQGYQGLDAATCEWLAAPCACKPRDPDGGEPPWCVPASESIDGTVRKVLAALRRSPDRDSAAEPAVRAILTRLYPCPSER